MVGRAMKWRCWQVVFYPFPFTIHRLTDADDGEYDFGVHVWWAFRCNVFTPTSPVFRWW
jgi:hypothetical protein